MLSLGLGLDPRFVKAKTKALLTSLGLDPPLLEETWIETWRYHLGEERISHIKSWHHEVHIANKNIQNCHVTRCNFDNWEPSNTASVR